LDKSYKLNIIGTKRFKALSDVSLKIQKNEIISLLGENGAGKTTLISILTGLLEFEKGQVFISPSTQFYESNIHDLNTKRPTVNEEDISKVAQELNQEPLDLIQERDLCRNLISVCPQYDLLWMDLTVEENMRLVGLFKGIPEKEIDRQIEVVLRKINLLKEKRNFVKNLSGGMKRRISIGLALLGNSEIIILDEPTTGLDPVNRKAIWEFIRELKKNGKTILLTTHIMDEADILSDRVAVINKGELLAVSDTVNIKSEFKLLNLIIAVNTFSNEGYQYLVSILESVFGEEGYQLKYKSETSIKFNIPSEDQQKVRELVKKMEEWTNLKVSTTDFEQNNENSSDILGFFVESYELASLDLEEAYMMLNEKHEAAKELDQE
jgi:ABC-type multidrug transport system ATPase subunit